jgi:hypothetical protein
MKILHQVTLLADMFTIAGINDQHIDSRPYKREHKSTLNHKQKANRKTRNRLRKQGRKNSKR